MYWHARSGYGSDRRCLAAWLLMLCDLCANCNKILYALTRITLFASIFGLAQRIWHIQILLYSAHRVWHSPVLLSLCQAGRYLICCNANVKMIQGNPIICVQASSCVCELL